MLFEPLRCRHLREKYAVTWAALRRRPGADDLPGAARTFSSELAGVDAPANLLFFLASMALMVLTLHQSHEPGRLEDKTRTLAEELALLRMELSSSSTPANPTMGEAARVGAVLADGDQPRLGAWSRAS